MWKKRKQGGQRTHLRLNLETSNVENCRPWYNNNNEAHETVFILAGVVKVPPLNEVRVRHYSARDIDCTITIISLRYSILRQNIVEGGGGGSGLQV